MLNQRTRIILALLVIIALTFTILDLRGGKGPFSSVRSVVSSALGGVQVAASVIVSPKPVLAVGGVLGVINGRALPNSNPKMRPCKTRLSALLKIGRGPTHLINCFGLPGLGAIESCLLKSLP